MEIGPNPIVMLCSPPDWNESLQTGRFLGRICFGGVDVERSVIGFCAVLSIETGPTKSIVRRALGGTTAVNRIGQIWKYRCGLE